MELRQLEYFLMVSEVNSFTRAAERLYVSQPAVTNAIRSLEEELGIQLFDRNQKQALLTIEGEIFYHHIKNIMHGVSNTLSEINNLKNLNSGVLMLGLTPLAGIEPLPKLLCTFHTKHPGIQLKFIESNSLELQDQLIKEKIDLAVLFSDEKNNSLNYKPLQKDELVVCCSNTHHFRRKNSLQLTELINESLILLHKHCLFRQQIIQKFEEMNTLPQIIFESDQLQTIKNIIHISDDISILPHSLCNNDMELVTIPFAEPLYVQPFFTYKKNRQQSHAAEAFIKYIDFSLKGADS